MKKLFFSLVYLFASVVVLTAQAVAGAAAAGAAAGAAGGSWLPVIGTIGGAVLGGAVAAFGSWLSSKKSSQSAKDINKQNLAFQKQQFEYQKYLNNNQFQIMASDAQKAGINPIAMSGGNVQSSSFSGSSAEGDYSGIANASGMIGSSLINSSMNLYAQHKQQEVDKELASDSNATQKSIADSNNATAVRIEQIKQAGENQRNAAVIAVREKELQNLKKISDDKIASEKELAEKQRALQEALNFWNSVSRDEQEKEKLKQAQQQIDNLEKERNFDRKMRIWDNVRATIKDFSEMANNKAKLFLEAIK